MKFEILIDQPHVGAFRYRIKREDGTEVACKVNYGAWQSAMDAAIEKVNTSSKRAKRRKVKKWQ